MGEGWYTGSYGSIQLLFKNEMYYVLNGWDGKAYTDCYKSDMRGVPINTEEKFIVNPIKKNGKWRIRAARNHWL